MRYLLPAAVAAATIAIGAEAVAARDLPQRQSKRVGSHVSLHLSRHALLSGEQLVLRGRVRPEGRHRVKIVVRGREGGAATVVSASNGAFAMPWRPARTGAYRARAYAIHDPRTKGSASVARRFTAYGHAVASYYGPGLYGGALACGGTLQPGTLGVAHKTLPCGARVKLRYGRRGLTVRVVDRGPYVAGRDFDLTEATKARLGFPDVGVLLVSRGG